MKTILKLTLMVAFLGTSVLADGDMGGGNYQCPPEGCPPPPCTENCLIAVRPADEGTETVSATVFTSTDLIIDLVNDTLELY